MIRILLSLLILLPMLALGDSAVMVNPNTGVITKPMTFLSANGLITGSAIDAYFADPSTNSGFSASAWKLDLSLNNVENTALSSWTGTSSITTVGTIATGNWQGSVIGSNYGGAGTVSGILKANGSGVTSAAVAATDYLAPSGVDATVIRPGSFVCVFEGDSMLAPSTQSGYLSAGQDLPALLAGMSNFSGATAFYNRAVGGSSWSQQSGRYATLVYPHRPAAAGVEKSYLFLWTGATYYDGTSDADTRIGEILTYLNTARSDGFTVIVFTTWRRQTTGAEGTIGRKPYFEYFRERFNQRIRQGALGEAIVIDTDALVPDTSLTDIIPDGTHASLLLNQRLARYINSIWPGKGYPVIQRNAPVVRSVVSEQAASGVNAGASGAAAVQVRALTTSNYSESGTIQLLTQGDFDSQTVNWTYMANATAAASISGARGTLCHIKDDGATGTLYFVNPISGTFQIGDVVTEGGGGNATLTTTVTNRGAFFLQPGKYRVKAYATGYRCGLHQAYIYSITSGSVLLTGSPASSNATDGDNTLSVLEGVITIPTGSAYLYFQGHTCELRHYTELAHATGLGVAPASGQTIPFARLEVEKIGMP